MTLIQRGHENIAGQRFYYGQEIPPDLLGADELGRLIDAGKVAEMSEDKRRSLYSLFRVFISGEGVSSIRGEAIDPELDQYALPK